MPRFRFTANDDLIEISQPINWAAAILGLFYFSFLLYFGVQLLATPTSSSWVRLSNIGGFCVGCLLFGGLALLYFNGALPRRCVIDIQNSLVTRILGWDKLSFKKECHPLGGFEGIEVLKMVIHHNIPSTTYNLVLRCRNRLQTDLFLTSQNADFEYALQIADQISGKTGLKNLGVNDPAGPPAIKPVIRK